MITNCVHWLVLYGQLLRERDRSGEADETRSGSAEGESPVPERHSPNPLISGDSPMDEVRRNMLSALDHYADQLCEGWCEQSPDCANFDDCGGCLARRVAYQVRTHPTLPEQLPEAGITIGEEG